MITVPETLTMDKIEVLEKLPVITNTPIFESYIALLKEITDLEFQMTKKQREVLKEMLTATAEEERTLQDSTDEYLTVKEVAKLLGISPQMVRRHCLNKNINSWRTIGEKGEWRIDINQYRHDPAYAKHLDTILENRQNRKQRKQHLIEAVKELSQTEGYAELIDNINNARKESQND